MIYIREILFRFLSYYNGTKEYVVKLVFDKRLW